MRIANCFLYVHITIPVRTLYEPISDCEHRLEVDQFAHSCRSVIF